jgi:hypothetical protein
MEKSKLSTYIIAAISLFVISAAIYFLFIFERGDSKKPTSNDTDFKVKEASELNLEEKPYVTLTPTSDGAEIIISLENMSGFDSIEYELTYLADNPNIAGEKIERGSTGYDVNTQDPKYKKSVLLGTGSKGVRTPDKGITDGKLTLHLFKGETEYISESQWNLYEIGLRAETLKDTSQSFEITIPPLGKSYFAILAETVGLPPNASFETQTVVTPIYGTFSVAPKFATSADVSIRLNNDASGPTLYSYNNAESSWEEIDSEYNEATNTVSADILRFSTLTVTTSK